MIDIHTHVLPGLDDGSHSLEMTLAMLRVAQEAGTTDLVATPHADPQYRFQPERVEALLEVLRPQSEVRLYSGCDLHLSHDNLSEALAHPRWFAINQKNYLLIELSDLIIFPNTAELYSRLEDAGLRVILTHPERNPLLRLRPELIQAWVAQGRYMQITAQSLTGEFGSKAARFATWLMDHGLVHFVASDAHDPERRPPRLDAARQWIESRYGESWARLLFVDHPRAVLDGNPLELKDYPPRPQGKEKRGWLARWLGR